MSETVSSWSTVENKIEVHKKWDTLGHGCGTACRRESSQGNRENIKSSGDAKTKEPVVEKFDQSQALERRHGRNYRAEGRCMPDAAEKKSEGWKNSGKLAKKYKKAIQYRGKPRSTRCQRHTLKLCQEASSLW